MDRSTTLGFVLIAVVFIVWMMLQAPKPQPPAATDTTRTAVIPRDTTQRQQEAPSPAASAKADSSTERYGRFFAPYASGSEQFITVKTNLYTAVLSSRGGMIKTWELREFLSWDKKPVQLVDYQGGGDFSLMFTSTDGRLINTSDLYFQSTAGGQVIDLTGQNGGTYAVDYTLSLPDGASLTKRLTFTNGKYTFDADFRFVRMDQVIANYEYQVVWEHGLRYAEQNSVDESSFAMGYIEAGGELIEVDATKADEVAKRDISGVTSWIASRNKYFTVAMIPTGGQSEGAYLEGRMHHVANSGTKEEYMLALKMPLKNQVETARVTVYAGPVGYDLLKDYGYGLEAMVSLGAAWIIRPIAEYIMLPVLRLLRSLIPNYGIVIIVFTILIKLALNPLTKTSMRSMKRMQALQPKMEEIRAKYKEDPEKMNQAVFALYKEYGVNPASGCLPLLLQMPILFALYAVFRSSIDLRQAYFAWWITDLSIPDSILRLSQPIPLLGITEISGLALLMGITMFIQQKMTVTDPRQKAMVYMMPLLFLLMFNGLPSGLNLYYFVFNLLSIGQQIYMTKFQKEEPLRKVEVKKSSGGIMARISKDLPKLKR